MQLMQLLSFWLIFPEINIDSFSVCYLTVPRPTCATHVILLAVLVVLILKQRSLAISSKGWTSHPIERLIRFDPVTFWFLCDALTHSVTSLNGTDMETVSGNSKIKQVQFPFFYKQSIFDPRPGNCLSFSKKMAPKNCLAIVK